MSDARFVLMVGTDATSKGGIATVIRGYRRAGLFERYPIRYVSTHRDGDFATKAIVAARGIGAAAIQLRSRQCAVVHIHLSSRASVWRKAAICALALMFRRPYVLHLHSGEFAQFFRRSTQVAQQIIRLIIRRSARVLVLSNHAGDDVRQIEQACSIEVLPNGVELPSTRDCTSLQSECIVVYLGAIKPQKGVMDLIRAFAAIASRHPEASLVCGGGGAIEEARVLAESLAVGDRVSLPGWLDESQIRQVLARATIFALPSYAEGMPMALLEAMSYGLPIVTCPVGGIPTAVQHNENGLLVAPGDIHLLGEALSNMLGNPGERKRLGGAARRAIEDRFNLDASIIKLGSLYESFDVVQQSNRDR